MKIRWGLRTPARGRQLLALTVWFVALPVAAQIGPVSTQSLFFNQSTNVHQGDYVEAIGGLLYTDNVRSSRGSSGDTLALIGLDADTSRIGPRLDYSLASDLTLGKYLSSSYQTQPYGFLDGRADLKIVPGFFSWEARDTYSQVLISPYLPATPDNLEGINYATTGPRFTLRPTSRTTFSLGGHYSYVYTHSRSPQYVNIDNHRYGGDATLRYALSTTVSTFVTGMYDKVKFKDTIDNTDFTQKQGQAGFSISGARTKATFAGGYTRLELENGQKASGGTWNADLTRNLSPTQTVSLTALRQVTDAANLFRLSIDRPLPGALGNRVATGEPFTDTEYGGTWRFRKARTSLELSVRYLSERYQNKPTGDRDVRLASAAFVRQLGPRLYWDIGASYEHDSLVLGSDDSLSLLTSLRWRVGERLGLRFLVAHYNLSPHGYHDNQIGVTASYALTAAARHENNASGLDQQSPIQPQQ